MNKEVSEYEWRPSNPRGYAKWFFDQNPTFGHYAEIQKRTIFENTDSSLFNSYNEVPDELVRTPLQRAIQILKRHRDYRFIDNPRVKPISMIITTLSAHLYQGEQDVLSTLRNIVSALAEYSELVENRYAILEKRASELNLIRRKDNGEWYIPNPINPGENFADRWHEEENGEQHARAKAFFRWVRWAKEDLLDLIDQETRGIHVISNALKQCFGDRAVNEAMKKVGDNFQSTRSRDELKMAASTGILSTTGSVSVKDHTFYGEE